VLVSITRDLHIQLEGEVLPSNPPKGAVARPSEQFIAHAVISLPVGWQAIELYPRLDPAYWKPEYAPSWAKLDLLSAIAQRYATLRQQLQALLDGPQEPCHQFLKAHPELISPTHDAYWSKLAFGDHVSDFVFREPSNDYLLVEIEAPYRQLFRKDGHPRQAL